jgi:hypothetical protein
MRHTAALLGAFLALSVQAPANGPSPPRVDLQGITTLYLDVRVGTQADANPAIYPVAAFERSLRQRLTPVLSEAHIGISEKAYFTTPQLRVWINMFRSAQHPGVVAVHVSVVFSDVVTLPRLPDVRPPYQGDLWHRSDVKLVADSTVEQFIIDTSVEGVTAFLREASANANGSGPER